MTELDLTPNESNVAAPRKSAWRNRLLVGGIALLLVFVLAQALTSARVFFYNVDEAVAQRADIGTDTFRMQGVVVTEPATDSTGRMSFAVSFNDVEASVVHVGEEPSDLFEIGQSVVVEGRWEGDSFTSSQILVKHSENYIAEYESDRPGVGDNGIDAQAGSG